MLKNNIFRAVGAACGLRLIRLTILSSIILHAGDGAAEVVRGIVVVDHSGAPLRSAMIRLAQLDGTVIRETESDGDGRFELSGLDPGEYRFVIARPNHAPVQGIVRATAEDSDPAASVPIIRLPAYGAISGRFVPAQGGTVAAIETTPNGVAPRVFTARADRSGEFRIFGLPAGRYIVAAGNTDGNPPGAVSRLGTTVYPDAAAPQEFVIAGGEEHEGASIFISTDTTFTVSGTVGVPASGAVPPTLTLVTTVRGMPPASNALARPDGTFRVENLLPGEYEILASRTNPGPAQYGRIRFSVNWQDVDNLEVPLGPGRSAEFVFQDVSSDRSCATPVHMTLTPIENWPARVRSASMHTVAPDAPIVGGLAPARYAVSAATADGLCRNADAVDLDLTEDELARVTVNLTPPGSIRGTLASRDPASPAIVVLRNLEPGGEAPIRFSLLYHEAEFAFDDLLPGLYCIAAMPASEPGRRWQPGSGCDAAIVEVRTDEPVVVNFVPAASP